MIHRIEQIKMGVGTSQRMGVGTSQRTGVGTSQRRVEISKRSTRT